MADLEALVVAAYVFADEYPVPARCGRPALTSDAELVALAVAQAAIGISSDRQLKDPEFSGGSGTRLCPGGRRCSGHGNDEEVFVRAARAGGADGVRVRPADRAGRA